MRSAAATRKASPAKVVRIEERRRRKYVELFIEDMVASPRKAAGNGSNAAEIRRLAEQAIRESEKGSLTLDEIKASIQYALDFSIRWDYFLNALLHDMRGSRLAVMGGRVFLL